MGPWFGPSWYVRAAGQQLKGQTEIVKDLTFKQKSLTQ